MPLYAAIRFSKVRKKLYVILVYVVYCHLTHHRNGHGIEHSNKLIIELSYSK